MIAIAAVGDLERREAEPVRLWLARSNPQVEIRVFPTLEHLERAAPQPMDLVILIQSHPDEFPASTLGMLSQRAPLARWVVCAGQWCESEVRTRGIWPAAVRVPLTDAASRLDYEWAVLQGAVADPIPGTGSRDDLFLVDHPPVSEAVRPLQIGLAVRDPAYRMFLAEFLERSGHEVAATEQAVPAVVMIDLDPWPATRPEVLRIRQHLPGAELLGLLASQDPTVVDEACQVGVRTCVSKLADLRQFLTVVETLVSRNCTSGPACGPR